MKNLNFKTVFAILSISLAILSCNSKNATGSDIENPETSQDTISNNTSSAEKDSTLKNVDATRMSDGKDSVTGEVTPPNVKEE